MRVNDDRRILSSINLILSHVLIRVAVALYERLFLLLLLMLSWMKCKVSRQRATRDSRCSRFFYFFFNFIFELFIEYVLAIHTLITHFICALSLSTTIIKKKAKQTKLQKNAPNGNRNKLNWHTITSDQTYHQMDIRLIRRSFFLLALTTRTQAHTIQLLDITKCKRWVTA